jgi:hypothetical protein
VDERIGAQRLDDLHPARQGMALAGRHEVLRADADDHIAPLEASGFPGGVALERQAGPAIEHHLSAPDRALGEVHGRRADETADEDAGR